MTTGIKTIHIGELLLRAVTERDIQEERICKFFGCSALEISEMYTFKSMDTEILLKWCKLLEYDFFRLYTQHLVLYSPQVNVISKKKGYVTLPSFKKNIYTNEMIEFFLGLINSGEKTVSQIVTEYGVPRATICRWRAKHTLLETK